MGQYSFSDGVQSKRQKQNFGGDISRRDVKIILKFVLWVIFATGIFCFFLWNSPQPFVMIQQMKQEQTSDQQALLSRDEPNKVPAVDQPNVPVTETKLDLKEEGSSIPAPEQLDVPVPETKLDLKEESSISEEQCDIFNGRWIWEPQWPLYRNWSCPTLPPSKNCLANGRSNDDYMNWRWKPDSCELPRFEAPTFLRIVRGKKLAFIGDSVARNQMESLLCLLSQAETPKDIYKDADDRVRHWLFPSHNFTLIVLWTKFLVQLEEKMKGHDIESTNIYLDQLDTNWTRHVHDYDYIVLSNGHWFFRKSYYYQNRKRIGCLYCGGKDENGKDKKLVDLGLEFGLGKAFRTALKFIDECHECKEGLVTILRTFSPSHFEKGIWNNGGFCNRTRPLSETSIDLNGMEWKVRNTQIEELERVKKEEKKKRVIEVLDVTKSMLIRADSHPDTHWDGYQYVNRSDCVHWCLPGPIDAWNEMLLETMKRIASKSLETSMIANHLIISHLGHSSTILLGSFLRRKN